MQFLYLDKPLIRKYSRFIPSLGYYEYTLGVAPIQVTATRSKHNNELIADNLSSGVMQDKFMLRYTPTNKIYFTPTFLSRPSQSASCLIKGEIIVIGCIEEFPIKTGVLTFSSTLSINNLLKSKIQIYANSKTENTVISRAKVLAVGQTDKGDLFGLYYINNSKGLAITNIQNTRTLISTQTLREVPIQNYKSYALDDWFTGVKIKRGDTDGIRV